MYFYLTFLLFWKKLSIFCVCLISIWISLKLMILILCINWALVPKTFLNWDSQMISILFSFIIFSSCSANMSHSAGLVARQQVMENSLFSLLTDSMGGEYSSFHEFSVRSVARAQSGLASPCLWSLLDMIGVCWESRLYYIPSKFPSPPCMLCIPLLSQSANHKEKNISQHGTLPLNLLWSQPFFSYKYLRCGLLLPNLTYKPSLKPQYLNNILFQLAEFSIIKKIVAIMCVFISHFIKHCILFHQ